MKSKSIFFRAIVAIAMMFIGIMPAMAYDFEVDGIYYTILSQDECTVEISQSPNGSYLAIEKIQSSVNYEGTNYIVTSIGDYAFQCSEFLTGEIEIPETITIIGKYSFENCQLGSVTIPNSVTKIEENAFAFNNLYSITIPESIKEINHYAFGGNYSLSEIYWNAINCDTFINGFTDSSLSSIFFGNEVQYIPNYLFSYHQGLSSVTIPASVISISTEAFSNSYIRTINIDEANPKFDSRDNCNAIIETATNTLIYGTNLSTIPESVTSIGDKAFSGCTQLTNIVLPGSLKSIGIGSFSYCNSLTTITIPDSVTSIGASAFGDCSALTSITIPENVIFIGANAFSGCSALTSVKWESISCQDFTQYDRPFSTSCDNFKLFTFGDKVEHIPSYLCQGMVGLTTLTFPESLISIGSRAFYNCLGLTSLIIPENVNYIGSEAFGVSFGKTSKIQSIEWNAIRVDNFGVNALVNKTVTDFKFGDKVELIPSYICSGMYQITDITIPNSVTEIGEGAFMDSGITEINIPDSVTEIGGGAFRQCNNLKKIKLPASLTSINAELFLSCYNLTSIDIPNSVTSIDVMAFADCIGLTDITIPDSVTSIAAEALYGCTNLSSLIVGEGVKSFGEPKDEWNILPVCFGCTSINYIEWNAIKCNDLPTDQFMELFDSEIQIVIGDKVEHIPAYLCNGMQRITAIDIPESVKSIGRGAFSGCSSLSGVTIPNGVTTIGDFAFANCKEFKTINIPGSVTHIGKSAFSGCENLISVKASDLKSWCNLDFINLEANPLYYASHLYFGNKLVESIKIPEGISKISSYAFYNIDHLKSVSIPDGVTSVGDGAFFDCDKLSVLTIGNDVTAIGTSAFESCECLTGIVIPDKVVTIGNKAFYGCNGLTNITIPSDIIYFGDSAFEECSNLKGVLTIPETVNYIGKYAFNNTSFNVCRSLKSEPLSIWALSLPVSLETLIVPSGSKASYEATTVWQDIESIIEEDSNNIEVTNEVEGELMKTIYYQTGKTPAQFTSIIVHGALNNNDILNIKSNMSSLLYLDISDTNCTSIPDNAFKDKSTLLHISLPDGLIYIGDNAFSGCNGLSSSVDIPSSVESIGSYAFYNCHSIPSIKLQEGITSIGSYAFANCTSLTEIIIPNTVSIIGNNAFENNKKLSYAELPETLTAINSATFKNCDKLDTVILSSTLKTIENEAFYGCTSLPLLDLSDCNTCTDIRDYAFYNCISIETINLPSSLTSVGIAAFAGCSSLETMSIPSTTPPSIIDTADPFDHVNNLSCILSIPTDSFVDYLLSQYWGAFMSIEEKGQIDIEVESNSDSDSGNNDGSSDGSSSGSGHKHHHGCHIHYHKGKHHENSGQHKPAIMREATETTEIIESSTTVAKAITYSGSSVFVEDNECVTFEISVDEGYEIVQVLYGDEDVTDKLIDNTFTTPTATAGGVKKLKVILSGNPVVTYKLGDVNNDGEISVTDVVASTNFILSMTSDDFVTEVADINGDGDVTVTDIVGLTNMILGVATASDVVGVYDLSTNSNLAISIASGNSENEKVMNVELNNDMAFTAFQADIMLPKGMDIEDITLTERATNSHTLSYSRLANGCYRVISFSMVNADYAGESGALFTVKVSADDNYEQGNVEICNIEFTTSDGVGYDLADVTAEMPIDSSIEGTCTDTRIYTHGNYIVVERVDCGEVVISSVDGSYRIEAAFVGKNEYHVPDKGIYIVKSGETIAKVNIK